MKKNIAFFLFIVQVFASFSQTQTYDIITYTGLRGWKADQNNNVISYTITDKKKKTWCQIGIYRSTTSKGTIEADFKSEWNELVVKQYKATGLQEKNVRTSADWKIKEGTGKFRFNNADARAMLTTMTGFDVCVSILTITNSEAYGAEIANFMASINLKKPAEVSGANQTINPSLPANKNNASTGNYAFTITNFDDGWTSTVQTDWVEVKKANAIVIIHYPKEGTIFPADPEPLTIAAWNILVAPRYSNLTNFKTAYINTYERPYLGMGSAKENATGKQVYIVLFRQGQSGWLEFVSPDKNSFIQNFKFDPETIRWDSESDLMKPLAQMTGYNKFAVAEGDCTGNWTNDFTGVQQLYHVYTGDYAGMNINQSNEVFEFGGSNSYHWRLLVVNGMVGNTKYANVKSNGKFSLPNNWQIKFSDIEGKPRLYHAFFSCIKGARLLHLLDAQFPGSNIYTVYGKK